MPVSLDGVQRIRVMHDTFFMADGTAVPVHWDGAGHRCGTVRTAYGFLVADVATVAEVGRYVALAELTRLKG